MTPPRLRRLPGALALSAALALTGCAATTAAAPPKPAISLDKTSFGTTLGAAESKAESVHEHITTTVDKKSATIDADFTDIGGDPAKLAMRETLAVSGQPTAEVIYVDKTFYIDLGTATGNAYLKLDAAHPGPLAKVSGSVTSTQAETDPTAVTAELKKALLFVQKAGDTATIDAVPTTPYLVGLNASALSGILGPLAGNTALPAEVDIDYWIGADGLPRRSSLVLDNIDEETYYTNWGDPVSIKAPAPGAARTETTAAARDWTQPPD